MVMQEDSLMLAFLMTMLSISPLEDGSMTLDDNIMLHAEFDPLVHSDNTRRLQVHGVEHLLPGLLLLRFGLVQFGIRRSISIHPWDRSGNINEFGEGSSANPTILVCVSVYKHLDKTMVCIRVTLLILDGSLDKPDEILLGLVETSNVG